MRGDPVLLGVGIFFAIAATNILTPLLPTITADLDIGYAEAGVIVTAYVLARLVSSVICGLIAGRVPVARLGYLAVGLLVLGPLLGLIVVDVPGLIISRLIAGSGTGILVTLGLTTLGAIAPAGSRGRVMSVFQVAHNAGIAIYPLLGGVIGATLGWRATFLVIAIAGVAAGAILIPVFRRTEAGPPSDTSPADDQPPRPARRAIALSMVLFGVFATMFNRHGFRNTLLPLYAGSAIALDPVQISTGITVMSLIGLAIAVPGAMSGDRWGHRRLIAIGLLTLGIGDLAFLFTRDYATFLVAAVILGCGDFFIGSQSALIASLSSARGRARALGGFRLATDCGALLGPLALAGAMDGLGAPAAMMIAATLLVGAGALTFVVVPTDGAGGTTVRG
jgi:MFS family permease